MQPDVLRSDDLQPVGFDWSKLRDVKKSQLIVRFVFGAGIALVAGIAGAVAGPKIGGLFLAFPAILPASLTLIEEKEGLTKAWTDASGGVLGACGMAAFAATAMLLLTRNPVVALLLALVAWAVVSTGLYLLFRVTGVFIWSDRMLARESARHSR